MNDMALIVLYCKYWWLLTGQTWIVFLVSLVNTVIQHQLDSVHTNALVQTILHIWEVIRMFNMWPVQMTCYDDMLLYIEREKELNIMGYDWNSHDNWQNVVVVLSSIMRFNHNILYLFQRKGIDIKWLVIDLCLSLNHTGMPILVHVNYMF